MRWKSIRAVGVVSDYKALLWYETWYRDIEKLKDPMARLDRYERLFKYGFDGIKDTSGLNEDATIQFERWIEQVNGNITRYEQSVEAGKTGGRDNGYDHSRIRELLEHNKGNASACAKILSEELGKEVKPNTFRASKEYIKWRDQDGKPWYDSDGVLRQHGEKVKNSFSPKESDIGEKVKNDFSPEGENGEKVKNDFSPSKRPDGKWDF